MKWGWFIFYDEEKHTVYYNTQPMMMEDFYKKFGGKDPEKTIHAKKKWNVNFWLFESYETFIEFKDEFIGEMYWTHGKKTPRILTDESEIIKEQVSTQEKEVISQSNISDDIINLIREFSEPRNWKYGLRQKYLFGELYKRNYTNDEIVKTLNILEKQKVIYKLWEHGNPYWFLHKEYRVIEMTEMQRPDNIIVEVEEKDIPKYINKGFKIIKQKSSERWKEKTL